MRPFIIVVIIFCITTSTTAQVAPETNGAKLYGNVIKQNSGKKPLEGVRVKSQFANQQVSGTDGSFTLNFQYGAPGMTVAVSATKDNWVVVNDREMNLNLPANPEQTRLKIIMCTPEELAASKAKYDSVIEKYITDAFLLKSKEVDRQKQGWEKQMQDLQNQLEAQRKQLQDIADIYSRTNLDDLAEVEKRAIALFAMGRIDESIALRDSLHSTENYLLDAEKLKKIDSAKKVLDTAATSAREHQQLQVRNIQELARLAGLKFDFKKQEENLLFLAQQDSSNFNFVFNYAQFLDNQNRFDSAMAFYKKALPLSTGGSDSVQVFNELGVLYQKENRYADAEATFNNALQISQHLSALNVASYDADLASAQNNLGNLYLAENRYVEAETALKAALEVTKRLAAQNPELFESYVADVQNCFGIFFHNERNYAGAESAYKSSLQIMKRLAVQNPNIYEPSLANVLNNLGDLYLDENGYVDAEIALKAALVIWKRLAASNPTVYEPYVAVAQNNLGNLYLHQNRYEDAETAFKIAIAIKKRLAVNNPVVYEPDLARAQFNLGYLFQNEQRYDDAEATYKAALATYQRLSVVNSTVYERDIADLQFHLADLYQDEKRYANAETAYIRALEIRRNLAAKNPAVYERDLADLQFNLGILYNDETKHQDAESAFLAALEIRQRLAADTLTEGIYQPDIAETKVWLASTYSAMHNYSKALTWSVEAVRIYRQLVLAHPGQYELLLANNYGSLSWYYILTKQYQQAENTARLGLATGVVNNSANYDSSIEWINCNLAHALLFQGKMAEAEKIYLSMKDKTYAQTGQKYKEVFLSDLDELEKAGITCPGVQKIRELLRK